MKTPYSNEKFIEKARKIHHDVYDYSLVKYKKSILPVKIICKHHGVFEQMPHNHLKGRGCKFCANNVNITNDEFVKKSIEKHKDKYDYSLCKYINNRTPVEIICKIHGKFLVYPGNHLKGINCEKCSIQKRAINQRLTFNDFFEISKKMHNNFYDYSKVVLVDSKTKVEIICPIHNVFTQRPGNHMAGVGCPKCSINKNSKKLKSTLNNFLIKAKKVHGNLYDYSSAIFDGCKKKVKIKCKKHGYFLQTPHNHITSKQGCPKCKCSKGEREIIKYLESINLNYEYQKRFHDCKHKRYLVFDFYIPQKNICIEYDGEQHFKSIPYFGGQKALKHIKKRDKIKNKYCEINNIVLIRISEINKVSIILKKIFMP